MSRDLTSHKVNGLNEALSIQVLDEPGSGGACHKYAILFRERKNLPDGTEYEGDGECEIRFQNGPIKEAGVNGISQEALLAIVEDRLAGFQSGPYATRDNELALTHVQAAMMWLHKRTRERMARGVEGTLAK